MLQTRVTVTWLYVKMTVTESVFRRVAVSVIFVNSVTTCDAVNTNAGLYHSFCETKKSGKIW